MQLKQVAATLNACREPRSRKASWEERRHGSAIGLHGRPCRQRMFHRGPFIPLSHQANDAAYQAVRSARHVLRPSLHWTLLTFSAPLPSRPPGSSAAKPTAMGNCFGSDPPPPPPSADAIRLSIFLSTGQRVKVWCLPQDTPPTIQRKVEAAHGPQPLVAVKGQGMVPPALLIRYQGSWYWWEAGLTVAAAQLTAESEVKYQDISDQLANIKRFSNAHWAVSNGAVLGSSIF